MSNAIYKKDLHDVALAVAQGSKDYTDKTKEEIYWHIGDYSISTQSDNTTASTKTVPTGATRCKIKRIYGLTEKFNPSVAYDDASTMTKTMPNVVYDFDVSKVEGNSEVSENLIVLEDVAETTAFGITYKVENGIVTIISGTGDNAQGNWIRLPLANPIPSGTYTLLDFGSDGGLTSIETLAVCNNLVGVGSNWWIAKYGTSKAIVSTDNINYFCFKPVNNVTYSNAQFKPMLVKGSTAPTEFKQGFEGIHNLELSGLKVEGSNLFDDNGTDSVQYIGHYYTNTGTYNYSLASNTNFNCFRVSVEENTTYYIKQVGNLVLRYEDSSNNVISGTDSLYSNGYGSFTTPSGCAYVVFSKGVASTLQTIINRGSTALAYVPYIAPTTLPIDLTSIEDSGGNKLFADGKLREDDYITPYKARKCRKQYTIQATDEFTIEGGRLLAINTNISDNKQYGKILINDDLTPRYSYNDVFNNDNSIAITTRNNKATLLIYVSSITTAESGKTAFVGKTIEYELFTPIEVSIDWSNTLRGIQGYSNGTITLQNTYNMDTANTITYNSIIKENCCAKIVQSRGGSVVKTINLPTTASDGYSAGSVNNVRDFTTNKRGTNVSKEDLGNIDYIYSTSIFRGSLSTIKIVGGADTPNMLSKNYTTDTPNNVYNRVSDKTIASSTTTTQVWVNDTFYTDATIFKTANVGNPLYYELADASKTETSIDSVDNIIEVQPNDVLSFYDSNDNLVTVPSEITYRIEVERV